MDVVGLACETLLQLLGISSPKVHTYIHLYQGPSFPEAGFRYDGKVKY